MSERFISFRQIGVIHTGHSNPEETPIQPCFAPDCKGRVVVFSEYAAGLKDLEAFSHLYLVFHLHQAGESKLLTKPFMQDVLRGVFATRSPRRPNPIGLSIVKLTGREDNVLHIEGADMLDGTPLLDIKPYSSRFDRMESTRDGWQCEVDDATAWERGRRGYKEAGGMQSR
jgi:tRNA-Thr(GGU) m(6)t(6)A37 methyltransferase TsaA